MSGFCNGFDFGRGSSSAIAAKRAVLALRATLYVLLLAASPLQAVADTTAPSVPTGLVGTAVSSNQIKLSWNPATDNVGVVGYSVYLNNAVLAHTTAPSFSHSGLTAGTTYNYRVSAYDAVPNHSAWTATPVAVTTPVPDTTAPSVPTGLVGTAVSSNQIKLSWNPATDNVGVVGYSVYLNNAVLARTTAPSFSHSGLTAGTTYNYRVSAYDAVPNHSAWTATPVAVTTPVPDTTAPSVPTGLVGTAVSSNQIKLSWNPATDNVGVVGYSVYLNNAVLARTTAPSFSHSGLTAGTTYNYRVSAYDAVPNHSAWTATPVAVKTPAATPAPQPTPYAGTPIAIPGTFEAENFDLGGEGIAYHDNVKGNAGGQYRLTEDVDIILSSDPLGGGYVVNGFETGEWLAYTVNVAASAQYDVDIRASTTFSNSAFHIEIDGADVSGTMAVPNTGSWSAFQWIGKKSVPLASGKHVLKIVADLQYFNLNSVRVAVASPDTTAPTQPAAPVATAVSSSQINLSWSASTDNVGVAGYKILRDGVQIATTSTLSYADSGLAPSTTYSYAIAAIDAAGNASAQSSPVSVTTPASLDTTAPLVPTGLVGTAVSSSQINLSWNPATDNVGVVGYSVYLNDAVLAHTTAPSFSHSGLAAGTTYNYHVSAFDAVPNHSAWTATPVAVTTPGSAPSPVDPSEVAFFCTFATSPTNCGFQVQEKVPGRATIVNLGRDGGTAVRLHTEPGDNNVAGSGDMQRNDLWLTQAATDGFEGREAWWALSVRFPDDFVFPTWHRYALSGFHHTGSTGQGNFTLGFVAGVLTTDPGVLGFQGFGGTQDSGKFGAPVGPVAKNVWYDFVYHIRWSSGSDGFFKAWVNGVLKLDHKGPTLYAGQGAYLKLANYHVPLCDPYPACIGTDPPSSVIYDRVIRGTTPLAVSTGPLEGVLTLVNGVLTPLPGIIP